MPPRGRSTTSPLQLGAELRRIREAAGRTAADVAGELAWAESTLSRKENGKIGISEDDLDRLLALYQVSPAERTRLVEFAKHSGRARQRVQRAHRAEALPDVLQRYVMLEEEATEIDSYAAIVIPSLMQTPEYAAAISLATPLPEQHFAHERVATRIGRQAVFGRVPPPQLRIIIDEAVLLRPVGGPEVMRPQMLRLIEVSERPNITIQVLKLDVGAHPAVTGHFTLLRFDRDAISPRVFCDGLTGGVLRSRPEEVERYSACFAILTKLASTPREAVRMFHAIAARDRRQ